MSSASAAGGFLTVPPMLGQSTPLSPVYEDRPSGGRPVPPLTLGAALEFPFTQHARVLSGPAPSTPPLVARRIEPHPPRYPRVKPPGSQTSSSEGSVAPTPDRPASPMPPTISGKSFTPPPPSPSRVNRRASLGALTFSLARSPSNAQEPSTPEKMTQKIHAVLHLADNPIDLKRKVKRNSKDEQAMQQILKEIGIAAPIMEREKSSANQGKLKQIEALRVELQKVNERALELQRQIEVMSSEPDVARYCQRKREMSELQQKLASLKPKPALEVGHELKAALEKRSEMWKRVDDMSYALSISEADIDSYAGELETSYRLGNQGLYQCALKAERDSEALGQFRVLYEQLYTPDIKRETGHYLARLKVQRELSLLRAEVSELIRTMPRDQREGLLKEMGDDAKAIPEPLASYMQRFEVKVMARCSLYRLRENDEEIMVAGEKRRLIELLKKD